MNESKDKINYFKLLEEDIQESDKVSRRVNEITRELNDITVSNIYKYRQLLEHGAAIWNNKFGGSPTLEQLKEDKEFIGNSTIMSIYYNTINCYYDFIKQNLERMDPIIEAMHKQNKFNINFMASLKDD